MNFHFCDIASSQQETKPITMAELATYVRTDWMPGTPNSLTAAFVDLLDSIIETKSIGDEDILSIRSTMAGFEKQWKQVTSWILGVAFCRKVLESKGYNWWAPVSAFTPRKNQFGPLIPYWKPNWLKLDCEVKYPIPKLSRLLPDYVVARDNSTSGSFALSFAESKGCQQYIESLAAAPVSWVNQSKNAEFHYKKVLTEITQNLVIATRVNPNAKRPKTRRIYVRAWNSNHPESNVSFDAFRQILLIHYLGICDRIGLTANAQLLILNNYVKKDKVEEFNHSLDSNRISISNSLHARAQEETEIVEDDRLDGDQIFLSREQPILQFRRNILRVGLSSSAMRLVQWLQTGQEGNEGLFRDLSQRTARTRQFLKDSNSFVLRPDGVVGELLHA